MKKTYEAPWAEIEKFKVDCIITESTGLGNGGEGSEFEGDF